MRKLFYFTIGFLLGLILLFSGAEAAETNEYDDFTAKTARENNKKSIDIYDNMQYRQCKYTLIKNLILHTKRFPYTSIYHQLLPYCAGLNDTKLKKELESRGFTVRLNRFGIRGKGYITAITISW